jgi:hypothetical protein
VHNTRLLNLGKRYDSRERKPNIAKATDEQSNRNRLLLSGAKLKVSWTLTNGATQSDARRNGRRGLQAARSRAQTYGTDCFAMARPMLMRLSAITPRPTQRFMPASPL